MDVKELLHTIGERLQTAATVKAIYGDPVTAGDRTVIPVARVRFGFGAGGQNLIGGGGGGGVCAKPAGMIEISPAGATFTTFPDHRRMAVAFAFGISAGMCLARALRKSVR